MKQHLPIDDHLDLCLQQLKSHASVVVTAAPGAGKTTRLPAHLAACFDGKILVLEPRRMAALAAAQRVAEENNWNLGSEVGYQVRFQNKTQTQTKLIFMTEALLAKKIQENPQLEGVAAVVLDEFHERSLHVDLALGMLRELQQLGSAIKIVVMSATIDAKRISEFLDHAPIIDVPGALFPLETQYSQKPQALSLQRSFYEQLEQIVREALQKTKKDLLIFLPGYGEIEQAKKQLQALCDNRQISLCSLHGNISLEEQKTILKESSQQRIILSTNIAESSVTIAGVNCVIDSGLAKTLRFDIKTGFSRLELTRISLASATQRAGRAARQMPGICFRMWTKLDESSMLPHELPEVQRVDLSEAFLFLTSQGITDISSFTWFESPSEYNSKHTLEILNKLGVIDDKNSITSLGKKVLNLPLSIRLAAMVLKSLEMGIAQSGADLAALLQERDFFLKQQLPAYKGVERSDIQLRLQTLEDFRENRRTNSSTSRVALESTLQTSQQILNYLGKPPSKNATAEDIDLLLLQSFSDRLCKIREKGSSRALMITGRGVALHPDSVCVPDENYFLALDGVETQNAKETQISLAHPISKNAVLSFYGQQIRSEVQIEYIADRNSFYKIHRKLLDQIVVDESAPSRPEPHEVAEHMPSVLVDSIEWVLQKNSSLSRFFEKMRFLKFHQNLFNEELREELQKQFVGDSLSKDLIREAFESACLGKANLHEVLEQDLSLSFKNVLPLEIQTILQQMPDTLTVPSGSKIAIQYPADKNPYLEVRIQEIFGWSTSPLILNKLVVTLHLLGPNFRPVQVTADLKSFWQNAYSEVRKELRLKYPKHQWPEDPSTGVAEAKGRRSKPN